MVFFTCNGCGESLKKAQVEKHRYKCRNSHSLTCIDCLKDFHGEDYAQHLKCVSEDQKYGGANYVPKENKGEVKQEKWIEKVQQAIKDASNLHNKRLAGLLEKIKNYPNIPRKEAKFKNFVHNSLREKDQQLISEAWNAIAAKTSAEQAETADKKDEKTDSPLENGQGDAKTEADQSESTKKKRRNKADQSISATPKSKKAKNSDSSTENNLVHAFSVDQSENDGKIQDPSENQIDQSELSIKKRKKRTSQSESLPSENKKSCQSDSSVENVDPAPDHPTEQSETGIKNDPASVNQIDVSVNGEGGAEPVDNESKKGGKKLKSVIKKLLKEADEQKLPLKRLKKLAAKNLAVSETPKKVQIYEEIDLFLRKNAKKYVIDKKIVKFAQEN